MSIDTHVGGASVTPVTSERLFPRTSEGPLPSDRVWDAITRGRYGDISVSTLIAETPGSLRSQEFGRVSKVDLKSHPVFAGIRGRLQRSLIAYYTKLNVHALSLQPDIYAEHDKLVRERALYMTSGLGWLVPLDEGMRDYDPNYDDRSMHLIATDDSGSALASMRIVPDFPNGPDLLSKLGFLASEISPMNNIVHNPTLSDLLMRYRIATVERMFPYTEAGVVRHPSYATAAGMMAMNGIAVVWSLLNQKDFWLFQANKRSLSFLHKLYGVHDSERFIQKATKSSSILVLDQTLTKSRSLLDDTIVQEDCYTCLMYLPRAIDLFGVKRFIKCFVNKDSYPNLVDELSRRL